MFLRLTLTTLLLIFSTLYNHAAVEYTLSKQVKIDSFQKKQTTINVKKRIKTFGIIAAFTALSPMTAPISILLCLLLLKWGKKYGYENKKPFIKIILKIAIGFTVALMFLMYDIFFMHPR